MARIVLDADVGGVQAGEGPDYTFLYDCFQNLDVRNIKEPGPMTQLNNKKILSPFPFAAPFERDKHVMAAAILETIDTESSVRNGGWATSQELFMTVLQQLLTGHTPVNEVMINTSEVQAPGIVQGANKPEKSPWIIFQASMTFAQHYLSWALLSSLPQAASKRSSELSYRVMSRR
jgi:hypothetical protein